MKAVTFSEFGGPEVLTWSEVPDLQLGDGQALVRTEAAGMNFADVYRRQGRFMPGGKPPWIPGYEGAGTIVELSEATAEQGFRIGDKVGWADSPFSNAEYALVETDKLIRLPEGIEPSTAAAVLLQGLTAYYLSHDSHAIRSGEWVAVHAAAGGVGLLLVQIAKLKGARVIALASSAEKQQAAMSVGADVGIGYDGWVDRIREITGEGADVVYDSVGTTIKESLDAARARGRAVFYGIAGGQPPAVEPLSLMERSLTLTGGDLWSALPTPQVRRDRAAQLFSWILAGSLKVKIAASFSLADAAAAHALIESRASIGKILFVH